MIKPISPDEIVISLPDEVIEVFNELLKKNWRGESTTVTIYQTDVADLVASAMNISRNEVFNRRYLDVEEYYRKAGWRVSYEKPAYNESFRAYFEFSRSREER